MSYVEYVKLFDRVTDLEMRQSRLEARIAELEQQLKATQERKRGRPRKTISSN